MKTLLLVLGLLPLFAHAQKCERSGEFQNSSDITTSGKVTVKSNKAGKLIIKMGADFKTQEGPDLDVYLSKTKYADENAVRVDKLFVIEGGQRYTTDSPIDINEYNFVIVHCTKWNHWYGYSELSEGCSN